jgi:co-chaperonin GroES (HSP10)
MELKMIHKDILIKSKNKNNYISTSIILPKDSKDDKINFYEVIKISKKVTMVKNGDIILLENGNHTIPIMWKDQRCAVTSEDDVIGVLEE